MKFSFYKQTPSPHPTTPAPAPTKNQAMKHNSPLTAFGLFSSRAASRLYFFLKLLKKFLHSVSVFVPTVLDTADQSRPCSCSPVTIDHKTGHFFVFILRPVKIISLIYSQANEVVRVKVEDLRAIPPGHHQAECDF